MLETLCIQNAPKRYIVSVGKRVLFVTHDYFIAKRIENIVSHKKTDGRAK